MRERGPGLCRRDRAALASAVMTMPKMNVNQTVNQEMRKVSPSRANGINSAHPRHDRENDHRRVYGDGEKGAFHDRT